MVIHVYAKTTEDITGFEDIIKTIRAADDEVFVTIESKRSFRELENIKNDLDKDTIIVISSLAVLGTNAADILKQLSWFMEKPCLLVIVEVTATYEYGVSQPANRAVLNTIIQTMQSGNIHNIPVTFKRVGAGRRKVEFPENWEDLYEQWESKKISSKSFIEQTGLKKATFYNLVTEYRDLQKLNEQYITRFKAT